MRFSCVLLLCLSFLLASCGCHRCFAAENKANATIKSVQTNQQTFRLEVPKRVKQGTAVRVKAIVPSFAQNAQQAVVFSWLDKKLQVQAIATDKGYEAEMLLPILVNAEKKLLLRATTLDGSQKTQTQLIVQKVAWPEQQISGVNKKYVAPPKDVQNKIAADRKKSAQALARITPERMWTGEFVRPVPGIITSAFGGRRMFNGQLRSWHRGVDLRGAEGTPIKALAPGEVVIAEPMYYSGNVVYVDHGLGVISSYCHMSAIDVHVGDHVQAGQILGKVGATGRVTGPHLHLGLNILGQPVNALSLVKK